MSRSIKIMLALSLVFALVYAGFLIYDHQQFQANLSEITRSLQSDSPYKLQAAWFTVVILRSAEFLVPSLIFGIVGMTMLIRDNKRPSSKKKY